MIFVGDDWAEDHHDVHVMDEAGSGWRAAAAGRSWKGSAGSMSWSPITSMTRPRWWSGSRPIAGCGCRRWSRPAIRCTRSTRWRVARYRDRHNVVGREVRCR